METTPSKWSQVVAFWGFVKICEVVSGVITFIWTLATTVTAYYEGHESTMFYFYASMLILSLTVLLLIKKSLQKRGRKSQDTLKSMVPDHSFENLAKGPPINSIRLEACAGTYIAFASAMNEIASDSDSFSEDDLALISRLIFNDVILRKSLNRYKSMAQSVFATLLFILHEKGDFTNRQWSQMCKILLKFMGEEPKSELVREEMNLA